MNSFFISATALFFIVVVQKTLSHVVIDDLSHEHECNHTHINIQEQISNDYYEYHLTNTVPQQNKNRVLNTQSPQGIRITFDISNLSQEQNGYALSEQEINYIESLLESSSNYLKNLIKVIPRQRPIKRRGNSAADYQCIDVIPQQSLIQEGVYGSDLHIIVIYEYVPHSSSVADAGFCELEPSPIIGRIKFNAARMNFKQEYFQQNLWTTLHELTHVLGFSGNAIPYWIDPDTDMPYIKSDMSHLSKILSKKTVRGVEGVYVLHSKNILEAARDHFGCQSLPGLPLENNGDSESFGSHWEKDLLQNEYMTASRFTNGDVPLFSQFTAALLLDTGFYAEINEEMIQKIEFGRYRGCSFVDNPCEDTSNQINEYNLDQICELNSMGLSISPKNNYSECQSIVQESKTICSPSSKFLQQSEVLRNQLNNNSKCFKSTAVQYYMINKNEENIRCHEFICSHDHKSITVNLWNNMNVECSYPNQLIDLMEADVETYGQLTCPSNFTKFCSSPILSCQFNCHFKGFCNQGICYCSDGQIGGDCSHLIDDSFSVCQESYFENPDGSCRKDCPEGYYKNNLRNKCIKCNKNCLECFGEQEYQCTQCRKPFYLFGTSCLGVSATTDVGNCDPSCNGCTVSLDPNSCIACNAGAFLNGTQCTTCMTNCGSCKNGTTCTTCVTNYRWNTFTSQCELQCDLTCSQCSAGNNPNACTVCFNGKYLETDKSCKSCDASCVNCSGPANNQCTSCKNGQFLDVDKTCKPCDASCVTCSGATANSCLSCVDGKFVSAVNSCQTCDSSCITCDKKSTNCLTCTGSNLPDTNGKCYPCHSSCLTCSDYTAQGCLSCVAGYWVDGNNACSKCDPLCTLCNGNAKSCQACVANYHVDNNSNCVPDCDASCVTCSKAHDSKACLTCNQDQYVNATGECKQCNSPCFTCKTTQDTCTSCVVGYFLKPNSNVCFQSCYKDCTDCTAPADQNACISCNDGFYISGTQCLPCTSPCKTCIVSGTKCLSCISKTDYVYDKTANTCTAICDPSCKTCSTPFSASSCTGCFDGFYVSSGACLQCLYPCKTCVDKQDKCTDCAVTFELQANNTCKQICNASCVTCTKPYSGEFCKACFDGSTLIAKNPDGSGLCRLCVSPCKTCETGNETSCTSCVSSNYQIDPATKTCVPICDPSCVTCYDPKNPQACTSCAPGKFLVNDQCRSCVSPCKTCTISGYKCLSCVDKYSYDGANNVCNPICHPSCQSCYQPDDPSQCKTCADNAYESMQYCIPCNDPCKRCQDNADKCLECVSKIYAYDQFKFKCINMCHKSCKMCSEQSDPNKCVSCNNGTYLTSSPEGACLPCKLPCLTCLGGESQCTTCAPNYVQNVSNPKQCDPICHANCLSCSQPLLEQYCIVCKDGLFKSGDKCLPCVSPCQKCITTESTCLSCVTDYAYDNTRNACDPICDTSCKSCITPKNASKCKSCFDGFFLNNITLQCQPCSSPCKTCEIEQTRCKSCISSDYAFIALSQKCQLDCDPSCLDCSSPRNPKACTSCITGQYLTATSSCAVCTSPCAQCEISSTTCKTCVVGYQKDTLLPQCNMTCHSSCKTCGISFIDQGCSSCPDGTILQLPGGGATTGKCVKCQSPCNTCKDTTSFCLSCVSNQYQFIANVGLCKPICDTSCQTCTDPSNDKACTSCFSGFFLNQQNQCQSCQFPCGQCSIAPTQCITCATSDFTLDPTTNTCVNDCHKSCATCFVPFNQNQCKSCFDGFFLINKTCQSCDPLCKTCEISSSQCTSCIDEYQLSPLLSPSSPRKCLPICHESCLTCDKPYDQNSCLTCPPGYYYDPLNKSCYKCKSQNCGVCDNSNACSQCLPNYIKNTAGCQPICDSTCKTCQKPLDPTSCLTCPDGLYLSFGTCLPCKSPCTKCSTSADMCLGCEQDFTLESMKCNPICDSTCNTCTKPKDPKSCITCASDRYLDISKNCVLCKKGESVTPTGCISCPLSCESCDSNKNCKKCSSGYKLNQIGECQIESQVTQCHFSCITCISDKYDACTTCNGNRVLRPVSFGKSDVGMCDCPDGTTETNQTSCETSSLQKNIKSTTTGVYVAAITISTLGSIATMNPLLIFGIIEFSQTVSFFRYVNQKSSIGFDEVMGSLYTTHFTKLFDFESIAEKDSNGSSNNKRQLQSTTINYSKPEVNTGNSYNTKIFLNDKYPTLIANALALIILTCVAWSVSVLIGMMDFKYYGSLTDRLQKIFCISFPLVIFVFSSQEYSLLCFYQYEFFGFNTSVNSASSMFSIFIVFYIIFFLMYLTYKLECQKVLHQSAFTVKQQYIMNDQPYSQHDLALMHANSQNNQFNQSSFIQQNNQQSKILPQETITSHINFDGRASPQQSQFKEITPDQRKFYILYLYIKQDKWQQRNFLQIVVVRKIICAIITAYGFKSAVGQAAGLFSLYLLFWGYIVFYNPFVEKKHKIMYWITESVLLLLHMLLIILTESNEDRRKVVSIVIIVFIIITFIVYMAISFITLIYSIFINFIKPRIKGSSQIKSFKQFKQVDESSLIMEQNSIIHNQSIVNQSIVKEVKQTPIAPASSLQINRIPQHLLNYYQNDEQQQAQQKPKSVIQQQQQYRNAQETSRYQADSPVKSQSKRVMLEPISNHGGYENSNIQSGAQLYQQNQQQSPLKSQRNNINFNNNITPQTSQIQSGQVYSSKKTVNYVNQNSYKQPLYQYNQQSINQPSSQSSQLYNGTKPSKIYQDYY